jgi:predicted MFS family arabinose efflux permease
MISGSDSKAQMIASVSGDNDSSLLDALWLRIVLTLAMAMPMLILYAIGALGPILVGDLQIRPGLLGYVTMSTFGLASLTSPWAGPVVDRLGSKRALSLLFYAVAAAYALIVTVPGFGGVVAAVAVCGVAQALSNPVTNLLIAQCVPVRKKAFVVGLKQSGVQMGALFAGFVLPAIAITFGWRAALGILVPVAILLAAAAPSVAPPQRPASHRAFWLPRPNRLLLLLMSVQLCAGVVLSAFVTFLPVFATMQGASPPQAGGLLALFGAMGILSRVTLTPFGARLRDESWLLFALLALSAVALAVTMHADLTSHWKLWAGAAGVGLTAVATNAIAMGMLLRDPSFGTATHSSGLLSAAFFGGFATGAPAFGAIFDTALGPSGAWRVLITIALSGCALALALAAARLRSAQQE